MPTQKLMPMPIVKTLSPIPGSSILGSIAATTAPSGVTIIPSGSPLTRLNYFDGKFLRAADLQTERWLHVELHAERLDWLPAVLASLDLPFIIERPDDLRGLVTGLADRLAASARRSPPPA